MRKGLPCGKPLQISGTAQSTIGLPYWVSVMMMTYALIKIHNGAEARVAHSDPRPEWATLAERKNRT
jgi:hypothetical protein